jgi:serine/threonine protein kinase
MTEPNTAADDADRVLADCLEDYHRRRALAEPARPEDYADRVGDRLDELRRIVATEACLDAALGESVPQPAGFPRAFGEYTLVRELGRGAMGVVYEAIHRPIGRAVAVKVLRTGLDTDSVALERFRREARACAQVRHRFIVDVYDVGDVDGQPYYSMAILQGRTLQAMAGNAAEPQFAALLRGFAGIADALGALHRAGIVHRDVKPSNILVTDGGEMILSDFGLARTTQSERLTSTGQALGTPLYMSPEQMLGRAAEIDGRADLYGLGAAMYEVFVGRPIFQFDDVASGIQMILNERPQRPRLHRPGLPEALENVVLKCLERRKEDRYQDAVALRDDLLNLAEGRKVAGRPVSDVEHGIRRLRRIWPAIAAGVLASAGAAWGWTHREATVVVNCWPTARVAIDDVDRGETAIDVRLAPGRHTLTLAQAGFAPRTEPFVVAPGERLTLRQVLVAQAGGDAEALARMARELDVAMVTIEPLSSKRAAEEAPVSVLWPRGDVRAEDLATWRVDVSEKFEGPGRIEFRSGSDIVAGMPFDPKRSTTEEPIPAAVLAAAVPGARLSWGYVPNDGEAVLAEVVISGTDLKRRFDQLAERTKEQPRAVAAHLRAELLLDAGLWLAAYQEARPLAEADPTDRRAWLILQLALDRLNLRDTEPWRAACDGLANALEQAKRGEPETTK